MNIKIALLGTFFIACGGVQGRDDGSSGTGTVTSSGDVSTTTDVPTTGSGQSTGAVASDAGTATGTGTGAVASDTATGVGESSSGSDSSTGESGASSTTEESSGEASTGDAVCLNGDVVDTVGFTYSKSIDLVDIGTIQASYYNIDAEEIVFFSFGGQGRRFTIDGQPIGDVTAPAEALPALDGASYDQVLGVALLISQGCTLVEADPITLTTLKVTPLDVIGFNISICAGVAVGVDGNLYVTSYGTDELVTITRDGQSVLSRIDLLALNLGYPDGVSLIAGSENFLVLSTLKQQAAILAPNGAVVVPPGQVGLGFPPLKGGMIPNSDAILTVCGNGHAWACDEYGTKCHDFVPEGGDKDACACTIPQ